MKEKTLPLINADLKRFHRRGGGATRAIPGVDLCNSFGILIEGEGEGTLLKSLGA